MTSLNKYVFISFFQLQIAEEGSTISCVVERTRGALDYVHVFYTISQIESNGINYHVDDFANASGTITFLPWQRSEVSLTFFVSLIASWKVFPDIYIYHESIYICMYIICFNYFKIFENFKWFAILSWLAILWYKMFYIMLKIKLEFSITCI